MWKQCRQLACRFAMWESMFLRVWRFKLTAGDKNTWRDGRKNWGSAPLKGVSQDWEVYPLNSASPWYLVTWVLGVIWGKMFFGPPPVVRTSPFPANHTVVHQPHTNPTLNRSCFSSTKKHRTFHSSGLRVALWRWIWIFLGVHLLVQLFWCVF